MKTATVPRIIAAFASALVSFMLLDQVATMGMSAPDSVVTEQVVALRSAAAQES